MQNKCHRSLIDSVSADREVDLEEIVMGLHFKFPDGIERVRLVPTARVLKEEFGFGTTATSAGERTQYAADNLE